MTTMTGGEAVVAALRALGVRHVFGIVSVHNIPIVDAVGRTSGIAFVECRHEQAAVHAADGYARVTGELGVAITSTGPGAANAMGGLFEAFYASSPVLMITGQVESDEFGRGRGAIHQAEQQLAMLRTVTGRAEHISRHADIVPTLFSVASDMRSGRPRPAAVEIPIDVQYASGDIEIGAPTPPRRIPPPAPPVAAAAGLLSAARRPLMIAGGGVISANASAELTSLAEHLGAPVVTTVEGRGSIREDHPLSMGPNLDLSAMDPLVAEADVVLAVGTRFQQSNNVHKWLDIAGRLIHLDADVTMIGRVHAAEVAVVGDAQLGLAALASGVGPPSTEDGWAERCRQLRRAVDAESLDAIGPDLAAIMAAMIATLPSDAIVAKDATISAYQWANRLLPVNVPRTAIRPTSMAIGPGVPLGIGAAVATGRPTVVIQGDGGFMLSVGELATAVQQQLPLVVCVFNDRGYGILRFIQDMAMAGRRTAVDLVTPRFAPMAEAYGMRAAKISDAATFASVFAEAVASGVPWLLDIDLTALAPMVIRPQRKPVRS